MEEVEEMEVEAEEIVEPVERAEQTVKKIRVPQCVVKHEKYMDKWKEECHIDEVFDDVMGQKVEIHMKDLLACLKPFWDLMFKGSAKDEKGMESECQWSQSMG